MTNTMVKGTKKETNLSLAMIDFVSKITDTTSQKAFIASFAEKTNNGFIKASSVDFNNAVASACEFIAKSRYSENNAVDVLPCYVWKTNYFVVEFRATNKLVCEDGLYSSFLKKKDTETKPRKERTQQEKVIDYLKKSGLKKAELLKLIENM